MDIRNGSFGDHSHFCRSRSVLLLLLPGRECEVSNGIAILFIEHRHGNSMQRMVLPLSPRPSGTYEPLRENEPREDQPPLIERIRIVYNPGNARTLMESETR